MSINNIFTYLHFIPMYYVYYVKLCCGTFRQKRELAMSFCRTWIK